MWFTSTINWFSVKEITCDNVGGPHPISWKTLRTKSFPEKKEFCLTTAVATPAWVSSLPATLQISDLPARCRHIYLLYLNKSNTHGTVIISILHMMKTKDPKRILGQVHLDGEHSRNIYDYHGIQDLSRSGSYQCLQPPQLQNTSEPLAASANRGFLSSMYCFVPTWFCIGHSFFLEISSLHLALTNSCSSL